MKFKAGDKVRCVKSGPYITVGAEYTVVSACQNEYWYRVVNDVDIVDGYTEDTFELVQSKPKFKVGEKIRCVDNSKYHNQLTVGKVYTVVAEDVDRRYVRIVPDHYSGTGGYKVERFELVQEDAVLTPEEVFEHLRKGTKLQWRYKSKDRWQECINTGTVQVRCILDGDWRIKPEPEVIELNGKKYREVVE